MRHIQRVAGLLFCAGLLVPAYAQEPAAPKKEAPPKKAPEAKPQDTKPADKKPGTAPPKEDMGSMPMPVPGKEHEIIKKTAGDWKISGKFRMMPDAAWEESTSKCKNELLFGGFFVKSAVKGDLPMGGTPMPFEGLGIMGYDQMSKKFTSMWIDNMGSTMMYSEGDADAAGKTLTYKGTYKDPWTGADSWSRSVLKLESPDKYTFEMFGPGPDGKEFQSMVLVYERVKG